MKITDFFKKSGHLLLYPSNKVLVVVVVIVFNIGGTKYRRGCRKFETLTHYSWENTLVKPH